MISKFGANEAFFTRIIRSNDVANSYLLEGTNCYKLFWVRVGEVQLRLSNQVFNLKENECIFVCKDALCELSLCENLEIQLLFFKEDFFYRNPNDKIQLKYANISSTIITKQIIQINPNFINILKENFDILLQLNKQEQSTCKTLLGHNTISQIVILLSSFIEAEILDHPYVNKLNGDLLLALDKLLKEHIYHERFVAFYANKLNITPQALNKITLKIHYLNIKSYIDLKCIEEVKRALEDKNTSVKEVCYKFNFNDLSNFFRFFKRLTGLTPSQYKENITLDVAEKNAY